MRLLTFFAVMLIAASTIAMAVPTVFHPAEQVAPGVFGGAFSQANFTFPNSTFVMGTVGIGMTNPIRPLQIGQIGTAYRSLLFGDASGGNPYGEFIGFNADINTSGGKFVKLPGNQEGGAIIATDFYGSLWFQTYTGGTGSFYSTNITDYNPQIQFSNTGNAIFYNNATVSGRLGIGTANPGYMLHMNSSGSSEMAIEGNSANAQRLWFKRGANMAFVAYEPDNGLWLVPNASAGGVLAITKTGYVGIGTTSPSQALTVSGNANISGTVYASNISSNSPLQLMTSGTTRMTIDSGGDITMSGNMKNTLWVNNNPSIIGFVGGAITGHVGFYAIQYTAGVTNCAAQCAATVPSPFVSTGACVAAFDYNGGNGIGCGVNGAATGVKCICAGDTNS